MELFKSLQEDVAASIFSAPASYDGRKNVYTMYELSLGPTNSTEVRALIYFSHIPPPPHHLFIQFGVSLPRKGPPAPGARPPKIYKIKLTKVAVINTEYDLLISRHGRMTDHCFFRLLHRFIAGQQSQDNAVLTAIMVSFPGCFKRRPFVDLYCNIEGFECRHSYGTQPEVSIQYSFFLHA